MAFAYNVGGALSPTLFGDDWFQLVSYPLNGELFCPDRLGLLYRPLQPCIAAAQYAVFGLNIPAYHVIKLALTSAIPVFLYLALLELLTERKSLAWVAAALFVVLPTTFVQNWALLSAADVDLILVLSGVAVALRSLRTGSLLLLGLATGMFAVSLLIYELPLGLLGLFSLFLVLTAWRRRTLPLLGAAMPLILCAVYTVGRFVSDKLVTSTAYGYTDADRASSVPQLVSRLVHGYQLVIEFAWSEALDRISRTLLGRSANEHASLTAAAFFGGVVVLALVVGWFAGRTRNPLKERSSVRRNLRRSGLVFAAGILCIAAGFFPVILAAAPSLDWEHSHYNPPATIGLALAFAAALDILARAVTRTRFAEHVVLGVSSAVLVVVGLFSQEIIQSETQTAWLQQQSIWQQMFRLAPDFAPHTTIVLALPPRGDESAAAPIQSASFAFSHALNVLYRRDDLQGAFFYGTDGPGELHEDGVAPGHGKPIVPYGSVVVFQYVQATGVLRQVNTIEPDTGWGVSVAKTLCEVCILKTEAVNVPLRQLVN